MKRLRHIAGSELRGILVGQIILFYVLLLAPIARYWLHIGAALPAHLIAETQIGTAKLPMAVDFAANCHFDVRAVYGRRESCPGDVAGALVPISEVRPEGLCHRVGSVLSVNGLGFPAPTGLPGTPIPTIVITRRNEHRLRERCMSAGKAAYCDETALPCVAAIKHWRSGHLNAVVRMLIGQDARRSQPKCDCKRRAITSHRLR